MPSSFFLVAVVDVVDVAVVAVGLIYSAPILNQSMHLLMKYSSSRPR